MSTTKNIRVLPVIALSVFGLLFIGCDSGGNGGKNLSKEEAEQEVQNADGSLDATTSDLQNGQAASTASDLFDVDITNNSSTRTKSSHPLGEELLDSLDSQDILTASSNDRLSYQKGTYNWNGSNWTSEGTGDNLVLKFPLQRGGPNNLTFTLSSYEDTQVTIDSDESYLPTVVKASLTKDGTEIFSVDLSGTEFYDATIGPSDDESQPPKSFLLKALTVPQFHTFDFSSASKQNFSFDFTLERSGEGSELGLGLLINAKLTKDFDKLGPDEIAFDKLSGDFNLGPQLTFDYQFDVDKLAELDADASVEDVNKNFNITVKSNADKVGTIKFAKRTRDGQEYQALVVEYNNGDTELFSEAFPNTSSLLFNGSPTVSSASKSFNTIGSKVKTAVLSLF